MKLQSSSSGRALSFFAPRENVHARSERERRRGITLPEVVMSTLLVGIVIVGALTLVGGAQRTRQINTERLDGPTLALELWAEIMSKSYEDPEQPGGGLGTETGEAAPRENFDDIDDYDGWSRSPPQDSGGTAMSGYAGWTREVTVDWTNQDQGDDVAAGETGLKRFQVRVIAPDGSVFDRQGLRWKHGAVEQPPAIDTTIVTHLVSELRIGSQAEPLIFTSNLVNHADAP